MLGLNFAPGESRHCSGRRPDHPLHDLLHDPADQQDHPLPCSHQQLYGQGRASAALPVARGASSFILRQWKWSFLPLSQTQQTCQGLC